MSFKNLLCGLGLVLAAAGQVNAQSIDTTRIANGMTRPVEIAHAEDGGLSGYAAPLVDLKTNAKWMKDQIFAIRRSETGRAETQKTLKVHGSQKRIKRRKKKTDDGQLTLFD